MADKVFDIINKISEITAAEAHEIANKINRGGGLATKACLKSDIDKLRRETKEWIAGLETRMTWKLVALGFAIVALIKLLI